MKLHGVTIAAFGPGTSSTTQTTVDTTSAAYQAASAACKSLLPAAGAAYQLVAQAYSHGGLTLHQCERSSGLVSFSFELTPTADHRRDHFHAIHRT